MSIRSRVERRKVLRDSEGSSSLHRAQEISSQQQAHQNEHEDGRSTHARQPNRYNPGWHGRRS